MRPQNLINMPPPVPDPGPPTPDMLRRQTREERMQRIQGLIDNFTFSLGSGLSASANAGGGPRNRTMAGVGAALQAPAALQRAQQEFAYKKAQEERQYALNAQTQANIEAQSLKLPAELDKLNASVEGLKATTGLTGARQVTEELKQPLITDQQMLLRAQTNALKTKVTAAGILNTETNTIIPGTEPTQKIMMTEEIAKELSPEGALDSLVGKEFKATEINSLASALTSNAKNGLIARTADGVMLVDGLTGNPIKRLGGLPPTGGGVVTDAAKFTRAQTLSAQFDANPEVRRYVEAASQFKTVSNLVNDKWTGPSDMALVFAFMRALDPSSVVRESEYAEAAKTGNIFSGAFARFQGKLSPNGGFLNDQVKKDFMGALTNRLKATSGTVSGLYNDFARRIDELTGEPGGDKYLTNYPKILGVDNIKNVDVIKPDAATPNWVIGPDGVPRRNGNAVRPQ